MKGHEGKDLSHNEHKGHSGGRASTQAHLFSLCSLFSLWPFFSSFPPRLFHGVDPSPVRV